MLGLVKVSEVTVLVDAFGQPEILQRGKQRSIFREQYLRIISTQRAAYDHAPLDGITAFFQAPPARQFKTMTSSHGSPNGSDLDRLNDPDAAQEENDESESDASTSNGI